MYCIQNVSFSFRLNQEYMIHCQIVKSSIGSHILCQFVSVNVNVIRKYIFSESLKYQGICFRERNNPAIVFQGKFELNVNRIWDRLTFSFSIEIYFWSFLNDTNFNSISDQYMVRVWKIYRYHSYLFSVNQHVKYCIQSTFSTFHKIFSKID